MKLPIVLFISLLLVKASNQKVYPIHLTTNVIQNYGLALEAILGMGIRLQILLDDDIGENFLVSPISATLVIGQLMLGAEGKFQERLAALLSLPDSDSFKNDVIAHLGEQQNNNRNVPYARLHLQLYSLLRALGGNFGEFTLHQRNALFYSHNVSLKDDFVHNLKMFYGNDMVGLDFVRKPVDVQKYINEWGSNHTNGLIKTILAAPPSESTSAIFANAIYFMAEWEVPFSDILNINEPFNITDTKQINVTYMRGFIEEILYAETEHYKLVCLPYKNDELGMYIILPNANVTSDIKTFTKMLKTKQILETIEKANRKDVTVKLPKMTLTNQISILDQLKKYNAYKDEGVDSKITFRNRFDPVEKLEDRISAFESYLSDQQSDIYLTNAAVDGKLKVNDIVQQIVLSVNEKGTEAAAITASTIDYMGGSKTFAATRPFVFFIRHEASSAVLFWGAISNPVA